MPRIAWITDEEATGETAEAFADIRKSGRGGGRSALIRTMSLNPKFMKSMWEVKAALLAPDSPLSQAQYHMIASYVSVLTRCHF